MMIGELEYNDLMYSEDQKISLELDILTGHAEGNIDSEVKSQYYPFSAHFLVTVFIVFFSIIIMNLLFGLAVTDVQVNYLT